MFGFKRRRRRKLRERPFPEEWEAILDRRVPFYRCLPSEDQRELQGLVQVFLAEKSFEGCGGLVMTDEIRVTIAAQACVLLLHRETDFYPELRSILVYPSAYVAPSREHEGIIVIEGNEVRLGESWSQGSLVLSWDDVVEGAFDIHDGHNVVFHEFAHQLDHESGTSDGAPVLPERSMYVAWARVLGRDYENLIDRLERHRPAFLDPYAATNPAEFFAVATEFFFEKPVELRKEHPELYEQLHLFYRQDPAALFGSEASPA